MIRLIPLVLALILTPVATTLAGSTPESFADIVEKANPAVVNISTTQKIDMKNKKLSMNDLPDNPLDLFEFFEHEFGLRKSKKARSLGSGFIVDPQGYVVTSYHVIAEADEIDVMLGQEAPETYKAKVVGKDQKTDLALLKINSKKPLPYVQFGNSDEARVGDWVMVIGNPFGLGGTVTAGIISAKARYLNSGQYDDYLQTDASINKGNSGGPMFNLKGEVIGVNRIILSTSGGNMGIGFAIPSSLAKPIVEQLKVKGEIVRGWLGVKIQFVDENIAKGMGLQNTKGALVAEVVKDSPADKAGIKTGDIITRFDGKEVPNMHKLPRMVADTILNKKVTIQIFRNGKYEVVQTVIEKPKGDPFNVENENSDEPEESDKTGKVILGIRVANLDINLRTKYKLDKTVAGVVVTGVNRNSPAIEVGIVPGDVIQQVNKKKINSIADFEGAINAAKVAGGENVVILVARNEENRFLVLEFE